MKKELWPAFIDVIQRDVVPALGCTEPVSVALAAAIAMEQLPDHDRTISHIEVKVSPNLLKNGMGVMVPGTGMVGLGIAAAIGAIAGNSQAQLEVLKDITPDDVTQAKALLQAHKINVGMADVSHLLYAQVSVYNQAHCVTVTIADTHTQVCQIEIDGVTTFHAEPQHRPTKARTNTPFDIATAKDVFDFAQHAPFADIRFIEQAITLNNALSLEGLNGHYGLEVGATFQRNIDRGWLSDDLLNSVLRRTAAASDARMGGAMKPAMSNSGSGNQGIAATMPVVAVADFIHADDEQRLRAVMLSHLMAIYIKSHQNKLSALCGATTASMGSVAGITWLLGGDFDQISAAICNMIGDISGMICDGAKASCAMKVSSSAGAAVKAAMMALDGLRVTGNEGIVAHDVDSTIRHLSLLANGAMTQTDVQIIEIMVNK